MPFYPCVGSQLTLKFDFAKFWHCKLLWFNNKMWRRIVSGTSTITQICVSTTVGIVWNQDAKYVERWPNTTSAWAGWSRFDIPVDRYGTVHSLLICTSSILGSSTVPATGLASRKILIQQNIKKWTGPALWLLCGLEYSKLFTLSDGCSCALCSSAG